MKDLHVIITLQSMVLMQAMLIDKVLMTKYNGLFFNE